MPKVSLFKNVGEPSNPEIIDLILQLEDTRDGKWKDITNICRNLKTKEERDAYKRTMPTCSYSGEFSYRANDKLITHSEIINIDLDYVEGIVALKRKLENDKYVFSVFQSTSGYGLRVLFQINPNKHEESYRGISEYLFNEYGQVTDPNGVSLSKPYCVTYDPYLWLNPQKTTLWTKYPKETVIKRLPDFVHTAGDFDYVMKQITGRQVNICESYDDYLKVGLALASQFQENGRQYFHDLCQFSNKYKFKVVEKQYNYCLKAHSDGKRVGISSFYYLAKLNNINICSEQTKKVVKATKSSKRVGLKPKQIIENLLKNEGISGVDELVTNIFESGDDYNDEEQSILHELELYIRNNYSLRLNEVTGYLEHNKMALSQGYLNSMFISAKKVIPKLDYPLMKRLLMSDFVETYNPFYEFLGSDGIPYPLPAISVVQDLDLFPSPLIDKLASCIKNDQPAYTCYFLRKWIVSIISAMHKVHSPLEHILVGPPETGKTEFYRRLLPKELVPYYAESKLDKGKDDELLMTQYIVIMYDELSGRSKQEANKMKALTSVQHYYIRRPYAENNEKILRLSVLCGTSNILQIINDPVDNRRIIPTEVDDLDRVLYNSIDKRELFFEAFRLYKAGFDWRVTRADMPYLNINIERYQHIVKEKELIEKYFEPCEDHLTGYEVVTSTDFLVEIEFLTRQKCNPAVLRRQLELLGYEYKSRRVGKFKVVKAWGAKRINRPGSDTTEQPLNF